MPFQKRVMKRKIQADDPGLPLPKQGLAHDEEVKEGLVQRSTADGDMVGKKMPLGKHVDT